MLQTQFGRTSWSPLFILHFPNLLSSDCRHVGSMSAGDKIPESDTLLQMEEQSRQLACDRCRGQKLRCERNNAAGRNDGPCRRCAKARARCTSRPPRRLGRPRQQSHPPSSASSKPNALPLDSGLQTIQTPKCFQDGLGSQEILRTEHVGFETFLTSNNVWGSSFDWPVDGSDGPPTSQECDALGDGQYESQLGDIMVAAYTSTSPISGLGSEKNSNKTSPNPSPSSSPQEEHMSKVLTLTKEIYYILVEIKVNGIAWGSSTSDVDYHGPANPKRVSSQGTQFQKDPTSRNDQYHIGRMLNRSQEFLQIIKYVIGTSADKSSLSSDASSESPCSDLYESGWADSSNASQVNSTTPTYGARKSQKHSFDTASSTSYASSVSELAARPDASPISVNLPKADFPTVLAIFTCYVALLRLYRVVFAHIHSLLLDISLPLNERPPLLPGLQVAGFRLDNNYNLQINILQQISGNMLTQMEKATRILDGGWMEAPGSARESSGGRVRDKTFQNFSLLKTILQQESSRDPSGHGNGTLLPLKETMESIKRILKGAMVF